MNLLKLVLQDHEIFHSEFQIRNFIIARTGGTLYGAYKQTIRELWHRLTGIVAELPKSTLTNADCTVSVMEHVPNTSIDELEGPDSLPAIRDTLRECVILYFLAKSLKEKLGPLDCELKQHHEQELWVHRVRCAIAVDFLSAGHLSGSTVEMVHSLPLALRNPIIETLQTPLGQESIIRWYLSYSLELPPWD